MRPKKKSTTCSRTLALQKLSRGYDSEKTQATIKKTFSEAFNGLSPFDWQTDVCEALLLGLDVILIAGTGAGKTMSFAMPLLVDQTKRRMVIVISPLNALEHDQAERFKKPPHGKTVTAESLNRLVASAADDSPIIGICGETKLENEEGSWWDMIQVYEYYISHHLSKASLDPSHVFLAVSLCTASEPLTKVDR